MGQIIQLINSYTKENVNYEDTSIWYDGTLMDDTKVDNVIYRKKGDKYYVNCDYLAGNPISLGMFGIKADGNTDNTVAINKAISIASIVGKTYKGITLKLPYGDTAIADTIIMPDNTKFISLIGEGKPTTLCWIGVDNKPMILFDKYADEAQVSIEKIAFVNKNNAKGVKGIQISRPDSDKIAVVNVTIKKNLFYRLDIAIDAYKESDQIVIWDNYILGYKTAGIRTQRGVCQNWFIENNHFRGGHSGSIGILHQGGSNCKISGNTIQTAEKPVGGIKLVGVNNFSITNTYYERIGTSDVSDKPAISVERCAHGNIENNISTGNVGSHVVFVNAACQNITFGANTHYPSGSTASHFLLLEEGASNIFIYALQTGTTFPYSGLATFAIGGNRNADIIFSTNPFSCFSNNNVNIPSLSTYNIGSLAPGAYLAFLTNLNYNNFVVAIIISLNNGLMINRVFSNNLNQTDFDSRGNILQVHNKVSTTLTHKYNVMRIG